MLATLVVYIVYLHYLLYLLYLLYLIYLVYLQPLHYIPSEFFGLISADGADRTAPSFFDHIGICVFTPFNM